MWGGEVLQRRVEGIVLHPCAHQHRAEGVRSTPVHVNTGGQILTLVRVSTGCEVEVPSPVHISAARRESTGGVGGSTRWRVWRPAPALFSIGRRDRAPPPCAP